MDVQILINSIDRTNLIKWKSFSKKDRETSRVDTFKFKYNKYGSRTWVPAREDEIIINDLDTATRIFGGRIVGIQPKLKRNGTADYVVRCLDWMEDFDDELVVRTYEAQTIQQIVDDIKPAGFTSVNVDGAIVIDRITFNYETKSNVMRDLADQIGFHWYIDYYKDIHFFSKSTEISPFNITDTSDELIGGTLSLDISNAQLRNEIYVLGGETVGASRTEPYSADGDQDFFPLANKFSELPVVKLNTVAQTVGVSPLETFADGPYQVLWDFNQKNIQFDTIPTAGDAVEVIGTPLAEIGVKVNDAASVAQFGVKQHRIVDKTLKDTDTARQRGIAELESYANGITSGSFQTYTDGLRSGQTITVNSVILGVNEQYIIKSVSMKMHTQTQAIYTVQLVSKKIVEVVEFLQNLLRDKGKTIEVGDNNKITIIESTNETINIAEVISLDVEKAVHETIDIAEQIRKDPWGAGVVTAVWGPYFPINDADPKRPFRWNRFRWA